MSLFIKYKKRNTFAHNKNTILNKYEHETPFLGSCCDSGTAG